jgi:thiol:disulfide interchange protein DsbC
MKNMLFKALLITLAAALPWQANAGDQAPADSIRAKIAAAIPQLPIEEVVASPIEGLFEVKLASGGRLFVTPDGEYFVFGDMFKVEDGQVVNLTELQRNEQRQQVAVVAEEQGITYTPANKKASVTVFTDVDCGYCRKLHGQMAGYLAKGIEIRYLAFPRAGVGSPVYQKMVSAWCAPDQKEAMDKLKGGKSVATRSCENPVAAHYELGNAIGVTGTPALVLDSGQLIPGYQTPDQLARILGI